MRDLLKKHTTESGLSALQLCTSVSLFALSQTEDADAKLTGMTRSLDRRLLALNLPSQRIQPVSTSAALPLAQRVA